MLKRKIRGNEKKKYYKKGKTGKRKINPRSPKMNTVCKCLGIQKVISPR